MTRSRDSAELPSPDSIPRNTPNNSTGRSDHILSTPQGPEAINSQFATNLNPNSAEIASQSNQTNTPKGSTITDQIFENSPIFDWDKDAVFRRTAKYYGPTSFSAVFSEGAKLSEDLDIGEAEEGILPT
jgi:hypothetical protein